MADKDSQIQQFVNVTGADVDRARFYLESSAWNVELAISSFFEGGDNDEREGSPTDTSMPTDSSRNPPRESAANSRVQTFSSMSVNSGSSDEEGQAYYAGGSDRSGQQVLGPPKKKKEVDSNKLVDALFKSAREHGAEEVREDEPAGASHQGFGGSGYRLGETTEDTTFVPGAPQLTGRPQVFKKLKLWKNGFSVDDGPLRDYNDPANKQFLDSIAQKEVPQELVREARGGEINLDMEDHRGEEYVKPKISVKAFSGAGHMLGSPSPNVAASPPAGDSALARLEVDESRPVTSVQLRLADGTRLVLKLNHTHQISDIRQHITATNPRYAEANFCLMTTFPNKELTDEGQTLEEAKLLNAVIVQKMK